MYQLDEKIWFWVLAIIPVIILSFLVLQFWKHRTQRKFADMLQIHGLDLDKNAIQRIESGARFVTDIELKIIAQVLHVSCDTLLDVDISYFQ